MIKKRESNRWEKELAQFQEVLANPTGQAIVIVGPAGSGKSTLLRNMVMRGEKGGEFHFDGKIFHVAPNDNPNDVLRNIGRWPTGTVAYLETSSILERLSSSVKEFGDLHRRVIGIDANHTLPSALLKYLLEIIPQLPDKVKFIFTQRPDDILTTNKSFMNLPNVMRIDIEVPPVSDDRSEGKFKDLGQLSAAFVKFLKEKKGYHNSSMIMQERDGGIDDRGIDKGIRQYLAIFDHEKQTQLVIVEFGLKEDGEIFNRTGLLLENSIKNTGSEDIEGYVVFPSEADSGEEFAIYWLDKFNKANEQIYCDDFPDYEELRRQVGGNGGPEGGGKSQVEQEITNLEERDMLEFSLETKSIMKVALQLALKEGENDWKLTTREILVAIAYYGKRKEKEDEAAQFVLEKLRSGRSDYLEDFFIRVDSETSIDKKTKGKALKRTGYVGDVLREAKKFATSTTSQDLIHTRHLLASLLVFRAAGKEKPGAHNVIIDAGIELSAFATEFHQYVINTFKDDNKEAWEEILTKASEEPEVAGQSH